ncbi:MAG: DUF3048 domain-containing protein [Chloroflexota bacterium]|nr:MAG: DUF3048 domain-containing protein [Chloroflexota bacterium]
MTEPGGPTARRALRRGLVAILLVVAVGSGVGIGALVAAGSGPDPSHLAAGTPLPTGTPSPDPSPTPPSSPTPSPRPTPRPTPIVVPAPLTGLPVNPDAAGYHPIAVMIDDHRDARPQSGFNDAAVVWQAPAEGGIPRYMLVFQDTIPGSVGPVRSARQYYVDWAAEWNAVYVHVGGSPDALATLRSKGRGQLVWNADEFRYGARYLWRAEGHDAPHNVFSDGEHLRSLATAVGAADGPLEPAWTFGPDLPAALRPVGATLTVHYPYEAVTYRYDSNANAYWRYIDGSAVPQVDAADGEIVAPANVVILRMRFGALNDGHPDKHRLDADDVGAGEAIISTNGRIIRGTWSKDSVTGATRLLDAAGRPITLTAGQTFVQVIALSYEYEVREGILLDGGGLR